MGVVELCLLPYKRLNDHSQAHTSRHRLSVERSRTRHRSLASAPARQVQSGEMYHSPRIKAWRSSRSRSNSQGNMAGRAGNLSVR